MSTPNAAHAGTFKIGGDIEVNRLGFGAMRITGRGIWGEPADRPEAIRTLKRLPALGVNFIDTADAYGPERLEELIHEALAPLPGRHGRRHQGRQHAHRPRPLGRRSAGRNTSSSRPISAAAASASRPSTCGSSTASMPKVPRDEQFAAIKTLLDDGVIRYAGLSEVSVEEIKAASKFFTVATVQNRYNLVDRHSEDVLDYCAAEGIGFIPWAPLSSGHLAGIAARGDRQAPQGHPLQIALAWLLKRSPVMLPIPGTSRSRTWRRTSRRRTSSSATPNSPRSTRKARRAA